MKKLLLILVLSFPLFATQLTLSSGSIFAHAEMLMDSKIDPISNSLKGDINIDGDDITSIYGKLSIELATFKSEKDDRDENMYETLEVENFVEAVYTIDMIVKDDTAEDTYTIKGKLDFHGVTKQLDAKANISIKYGELILDAKADLLMEQFGIEMPCMVFMCVDEKVELSIKASFK